MPLRIELVKKVMRMLRQILGEFLKLDGVTAAAVAGRDGFVIESVVAGDVDIEALGAMHRRYGHI